MLSVGVLGPTGTHQYLHEVARVGALPGNDPWLRSAWLQGPAIIAVEGLLLILAAWAARQAWRIGPDGGSLAIAAALIGSLLVTRYQHPSDLALYAPVVCLVLASRAHWLARLAAVCAWVVIDLEPASALIVFATGAGLLAALGVGASLAARAGPAGESHPLAAPNN